MSLKLIAEVSQSCTRPLAASFPACSATVLSGIAAVWMDYRRCHQTETHSSSSRHFLAATQQTRHRWPRNTTQHGPAYRRRGEIMLFLLFHPTRGRMEIKEVDVTFCFHSERMIHTSSSEDSLWITSQLADSLIQSN